MESDNENSLASSVSSLSRRVIGIERNVNHNPISSSNDPDEIDVESDSSDYELRSKLRRGRNSTYYAETNAAVGPISKIPPEVLLLVFSNISHKPDLVPLLTVCKRWGDLIVELLWFRPSLMGQNAMKRIQEVMKLDRNQTHWDYRRYIRRLNLSFVYERVDDDFLWLFQGCINLERLTLVNCSRLNSQPVVDILQGCQKLQSIDITGIRDINDDIFNALADNCPRLQGLYAPGCPKITSEVLVKIVDKCPLLKRVKLSDCENINDFALIQLASNCKALIEVDVHNCPNLTDYSLQKLFSDLEQLRELRISHNPNLSDLVLRNVSEDIVMERMRIIDLAGSSRITDRFIERIVLNAPKLRNVVLSKCLNITDASLKALANLGKNLHYIHLGHCSNITDYGVTTLVRNCHRLQYIDLACCTQLTNIALVELAHLPRLKRIGLVKCSNINDAGILALIQHRGYDDSLERVHLSYCTQIGIYPIYQLLQSCPKLTHLSLTGIASFLRPDITKYCRPPPPDFNEHQRALFCVFSGQGVRHLRDYFTRLFLNQTPLASGDNLADFGTDTDGITLQQFNRAQNFERINELFRRGAPDLPEQLVLERIFNGGNLQPIARLGDEFQPRGPRAGAATQDRGTVDTEEQIVGLGVQNVNGQDETMEDEIMEDD